MDSSFTKWLGGSFVAGVLFWGGVSYNRLNAIEAQLTEMKTLVSATVPSAAAMSVMQFRLDQMQREIDSVKRSR